MCAAKGDGRLLVSLTPDDCPAWDAKFRGLLRVTVNAASKGHLPVVLYLLSKQQADPLVRNNWGETAYDVAAAVFEVWICEVSVRTSGL